MCKVFCTHLRDLFLNRAWSLSSALDAFSCKQSLIFACRLNYPAKLHAATACRFCVRPAHRCKNFAGGFVGGVRGFLLPAISVSSLAVSSSLNIVCSRRKRRVFLMCAKFFAHICTISLKLCVEPVVCARRSRILRALIAFSCRQQLYNNKRISFTDFSFHFSMK